MSSKFIASLNVKSDVIHPGDQKVYTDLNLSDQE